MSSGRSCLSICLMRIFVKKEEKKKKSTILAPFLQFRGASHLTERTGQIWFATLSRCPFVQQTTFRIWTELLESFSRGSPG